MTEEKHEESPVPPLENLQKRVFTPEEKHSLLFNASKHVLKKLDLRFNVSRDVLKEFDLQEGLSSIGLTIQEIEDDSFLGDVERVREFYIDNARNTEKEGRFKIPLEFLTMLDVAAREVAYWKGDFQCALDMLDTSYDIFSNSWSDVTVEDTNKDEECVSKDEERANTGYLRACLLIGLHKFDLAHEEIKRAIQQYLDQRVEFRSEVRYKGREWLFRGCMAQALDGKGCHQEAEGYYRDALRLRPPYIVYNKYEVDLGNCMLLQGKTKEAKAHLAKFLLELEGAPFDHTKDYRTGLTLYWLGNAYLGDGDDGETAFNFHKQAFKCLRASLGEKDPIFGMASYKVGLHYYNHARNNPSGIADLNAALHCFETAEEAFCSGHKNAYQQADCARILYDLTSSRLQLWDETKTVERSGTAL
ncbi:uncharacterized protein N7479_008915 [Penicillium vulpinum]|uniref:MalT-like TPR region domain-containing protein n=1 Tax=Penicillium vulpinum TaxID=29845 RepID=A0A1V6RFP9_9EURO|nr:uncharacterized protein N7479_008915 [Penicillium vulpinum]KAJ5950502.1 hypothetical protein N7479_008915 [Penicillium vulpinum]OQE00338.1 hypothetical protein PENVUL_c053G04372 [Penicillium vulpinum]